jgi:regulator of CtrA degradation
MSAADSIFFKRTFDEVVALLLEVRTYLERAEPALAPGLAPLDRLQVSAESLRITARLAQITAWMLAQRAVAAGEISAAEAGPSFTLPDEPIWMSASELEAPRLPERMLDLLERSRLLYIRVRNLDQMIRKSLADQADKSSTATA